MKVLMLWVVMLMVSQAIPADVYKWTDDQGIVHYSDSKPENEAYVELDFKVSTYENVSYGNSNVDAGKQVIIYSASWCGVCKKAKRYFRSKGIPFTEYDIEKSKRAKSLYQKMGAKGVPVILVGKKRMNGFTEAGFERIYR